MTLSVISSVKNRVPGTVAWGLPGTVIAESLPEQVTFELRPEEKGEPRSLNLNDAEFSVLFAVC